MIRNIKFAKHLTLKNHSQKALLSSKGNFFFSQYKSKFDIQQIIKKYYQKNQLLPGYATQTGTTKYKNRFISNQGNGKSNENGYNVHPSFYKSVNGIKNQKIFVSNLGLGTQNAEPTPQYDYPMLQTLLQGMTTGINYLDTDINFRFGKSQKLINTCLNYLIKQQKYSRQQFFISTKLGYIPTDIDSDLSPQKFIQFLKNGGFIKDQNIVENIYGWGQGFIQFCIEKSRVSLGVDSIDCVFLNNFSQAQMSLVNQNQFNSRLKRSFSHLQKIRESGKIRNYGICSYVGFRSPPNETGVHLNLQKVIKLAKQSAGDGNGLKFIMLPLNLGMPQSLLKWQPYKNSQNQSLNMRIFQIAEKQNINIVTCSPLFQGRVATLAFQSKKLNFLQSHASKHLHFIRSINSPALLTTVFGTINPQHLRQNLSGISYQKLSAQDWKSILPIPQ